ncbi:MAG: TonB-dependent receptor [Bacteroidales bacterium]|nr:TonB-dependent receptor [Bacteroidales bacterium]MBD5376785.1 TonB-dependent receptor [Bacteroides sp.]
MKNICLQMSRKAWLALTMVLCLSFPALAQKISVSGTVVDPSGEPLIGASVIAQGTSNGTATDIDGNYQLDVDANATLLFSYVGYDNQEVAVNGRTHIDVTMSENTVMLGEVVAIGYGVVKKSDATGSIAVIKPDDVEAGIATSTQDLLVGASPGVTVTLDGGNPTGNGTIRIRGGSSLRGESNDPLIVIDGVPQTNQSANGLNALSMINPQDIEQLTVLKDASATAIYGSRASNGVIIITTKKGVSGKPKVNFAANWHVNTARKTLDVMDGLTLSALVANRFGSEQAALLMGDADTDWQKEVLRTSFSQDYSLSVAGQAGWLPYRVSASYTDNQGILKESGMQRTTVGFSLSPKFFNGLLSINANANGTYSTTREADTGAVGTAMHFNSSLPVFTDYPTAGNSGLKLYNGYTNLVAGTLLDANRPVNPLQLLKEKDKSGKNLASSGNLQIDYALHFLPELHLNLNLGYQVSENTRHEEIAQNSAMAWNNQQLANEGQAGAGTRSSWYELQRNTLLDFYLNYRKDFDVIQSNLDVMAGYSWQRFSYFGHEQNYYHTAGFQSDPFYPAMGQDGNAILNFADGDLIGEVPGNAPMSRWANHLQLISFFGRLNYSLQDTYLLTFTLRDDASSRFAKDNRWGLFPSLALAWKISNMPVFEDVRGWWNDFKLRLGWGVTGQQELGSYFPYFPIYTNSYQNGFLYPDPAGNWIEPLYPQPYDANITWEKTTTWNAGLDFAFLNNRFTASVDWYLRKTTDMLLYGVTTGVNTSNMLDFNAGAMRNVGVEITLGGRPIVTRDFTWNTGINIAYNDNKITQITKGTDRLSAANTPSGIGTPLQWHIVGESVRSFLVYEQVYDKAGNPVPDTYVDQNGDGQITDADKIVFHSPDPKWTFNWNNTFSWNHWDLGITLRANLGNYVYNGPRYDSTNLSNLLVNNIQVNNMMTGEYLFPNQAYTTSLNLSSYWIENASFLRCDNISLGYTFENLINGNLNLRLFGVVQNPFVITKYKGIDPEVFGGIDNNVYPRPITCTLGLVATF